MNTQPFVNGVRDHEVPTDEQVTGLLTELENYQIEKQLKAEWLLVVEELTPPRPSPKMTKNKSVILEREHEVTQ